jgi:hypothetical protein
MIFIILLIPVVLFLPGLFFVSAILGKNGKPLEIFVAAIPLSILSHKFFTLFLVFFSVYSRTFLIFYFIAGFFATLYVWKDKLALSLKGTFRFILSILFGWYLLLFSIAVLPYLQFKTYWDKTFLNYSARLLLVVGLALSLMVFLSFIHKNKKTNLKGIFQDKVNPLYTLLGTLIGAVILFRFAPLLGEVFHNWDVIMSYNRWAVGWEKGEWAIPRVLFYPHGMPILWATYYKISGGIYLTAATRAMIWIITFLPLVLFVGLYKRTGLTAFAVSTLFYLWLIFSLFTHSQTAMTEFPTGALALIGIYLGLRSGDLLKEDKIDEGSRLLIVGALCVCAAAMFKQAGIVFALLYPVYFLTYGREKKYFNAALLAILVISIPLLLWFLGEILGFYGPKPQAATGFVQGWHQGRNYLERIIHGFQSLPWLISILVLYPLALKRGHPHAIRLILIYGFPYLLIFGLFSSYGGIRNAIHVFAILSLAFGFAMASFLPEKLKSYPSTANSFFVRGGKIFISIPAMIIFISLLIWGQNTLMQNKQKKLLWDNVASIDDMQNLQRSNQIGLGVYRSLVKLRKTGGLDGIIMTNNARFCNTKEFEGSCFFSSWIQSKKTKEDAETMRQYLQTVESGPTWKMDGRYDKVKFWLAYRQEKLIAEGADELEKDGFLKRVPGAEIWLKMGRLYSIHPDTEKPLTDG